MLKTFFLTITVLTLGILGWFFWNNASITAKEGSIESMTQEEYKIFVKKALTRNTAPKNYILSKGKILSNGGYISDSPTNSINQENITVWYDDVSSKKNRANLINTVVWKQGVSGILESNMADIEAQQRKDQQERDKKNTFDSSSNTRQTAGSGKKLLGLVGGFPQNLGNIESGINGGGSIGGSAIGSKLETESTDIKSAGISQLIVWGEKVNGGSLYNQIIDISENLPENGEKYYKTYTDR